MVSFLIVLVTLVVIFLFVYLIISFDEGKWLFKNFFISIFRGRNNKYNEALSNKNKVKKLNNRLEKLKHKVRLQEQKTEDIRQEAESEIEWIMGKD